MKLTYKCKITNQELSNKKIYSESDISQYLSKFLSKSLCGDCFSGAPWGNSENKNLYLAIQDLINIKKYFI